MGFRKIIIRESAAESIAAISWFLEAEGLLATAENLPTTHMISLPN
jgi:hypothetical protein